MQKNYTPKILEAKAFAKKSFANNFRVSGETYFDHVNRVVELLFNNYIRDEQILICAYLDHYLDIYSDKKIIADKFGSEILNLIEKHREIALKKTTDFDLNEENINKAIQTYFNIVKDPKILLLRLANKVDNITTTLSLSKDKARKVAYSALHLYAPICHLLGISSFIRILESEAFKVLEPESYYKIESFVQTKAEEINITFDDIKEVLADILQEHKIKAQISGRIKNIYSIHKKLNAQSKYTRAYTLESLQDIAAMRILVQTIEDCYAVESLLRQLWDYLTDQRDDYVQHPKPSGYKSIHNIFRVSDNFNLEIQIKTHDMHEFNEFGAASHNFWKFGDILKGALQENSNILRDLNYYQGNETKIDHFGKYVYVFTPKGKL